MIPRKSKTNISDKNMSLRSVEPISTHTHVACDTRCHSADASVAPIVYASFDRVIESTRRVMAIHQESFAKLAE